MPIISAPASSRVGCEGSRELVGVTRVGGDAGLLLWLGYVFIPLALLDLLCFFLFLKREKAAVAGGRWGCRGEAAGLETTLVELGCGRWSPAGKGQQPRADRTAGRVARPSPHTPP